MATLEKETLKNGSVGVKVAKCTGNAIKNISTKENPNPYLWMLGAAIEKYAEGKIPEQDIYLVDYENKNYLAVGEYTCYYDRELNACVLFSVDQNIMNGQLLTFNGEDSISVQSPGVRFRSQGGIDDLLELLEPFRRANTRFSVNLTTGRLEWSGHHGSTGYQLENTRAVAVSEEEEDKAVQKGGYPIAPAQTGMLGRLSSRKNLEILGKIKSALYRGRLHTGEIQLTASLEVVDVSRLILLGLNGSENNGTVTVEHSQMVTPQGESRLVTIKERPSDVGLKISYLIDNESLVSIEYNGLKITVDLKANRYQVTR